MRLTKVTPDTVDDVIGDDGGDQLSTQRMDEEQIFETAGDLGWKVVDEIVDQVLVVDQGAAARCS